MGVVPAAQLLFSLYAIGLGAAFAALHRSVGGEAARRSLAPAVALVAFVVWSPVAWMGFLPFLLATPAVVGSYAAFRRSLGEGAAGCRRVGAALAAVASALHPAAGLALGALVGLRAVAAFLPAGAAVETSRRVLRNASVFLAASLGPILLATLRGGHGGGGAFASFAVEAEWGDPIAKGAYVLLALVGTFPAPLKVAAAGALAAVAGAAALARSGTGSGGTEARARGRTSLEGAERRRDLLAAGAFLVVALAAPAAVKRPSDLAFLDYRLVTVAVTVLLAHVRLPRRPLVDGVTWAAAGVATAAWAFTFTGLRGEQRSVARLLSGLEPGHRLLALPIDPGSRYLDERNTATRYWPLWHTITNGGLTSSFWGRFSPHLPVGYREGEGFPSPHDWRPWEVTSAHLAFATHVLIAFPDDAEGEWALLLQELRARVSARARSVVCEDRLCLFTLREERPASPREDGS